MKFIPRFSINYPTTVMMVVLGILLLGYISFQRLGIDLLPDLNSPRLFVEVEAGEIPPQEMEELYVSRMEGVIARARNVVNVSSISRVGKALITVEYRWETDMDEVFLDLQKSMAEFSQNSDIETLTVSQHDPNSTPTMVVILSELISDPDSDSTPANPVKPDLDSLRKVAENNLRNQLVRLPGVAAVETVGEVTRQIQVKTDLSRLQAYGLTLDQLSNTIKNSNRDTSGGSIVEMGVKYIIRGIGEFSSSKDIGNLIVSNKQSPTSAAKIPIYLRDVASVEYVPGDPDNIVRFNGTRCIALEIFKESDFNTMEAAKHIRRELDTLRRSLPNHSLRIIRDQSGFIQSAVTEVEETGLIGIFLAILVLYLFLRRIGVTTVVGLAIPISVVATFNLMYFNDLTLNIMTLGGLALGAGMLVDNAIVVVENIFRHQELGKTPAESAVTGTAEVGGAITSSTLTTIIVFLPIVYLHGAAGELFREQAWTVAFSLLSSLFVALAVIPMLYSKLLPGQKTPPAGPRRGHPIRGALIKPIPDGAPGPPEKLFIGYTGFLKNALQKRMLVVVAALILVIAAALLVPVVGSEFIPQSDEGELMVNLSLPEGTSLERTEKVVASLESQIRQQYGDALRFIYSRIGPAGASSNELDALLDENNASIQLSLDKDKAVTIKQLTGWLDSRLKELPDIDARIIREQTTLKTTLGTTTAPLVVEIRGDDLTTLTSLANQAKEKIAEIQGLTNVETGFQGGRPEIDIRIDPVAAAQFSLEANNIGTQLKNLLSGVDSGRLEENGEYVDIFVKTPDISPDQLAGALLDTSQGTRIRLDEIASLHYTVSPREILRVNQVRVAEIKAHIYGGIAFDKSARQVEKAVSELALPVGYSFAVTGEEKMRRQSFGSLEFALLLAVVLVYMVMAAQFESLLHPFVILLTIPLALVGAVFLLFILGMPFNIMSFIGIIMLAGIAVNDSIILVDRINRNRKEGRELDEAIIEAGRMRIRPIIMTSATTMLALLPLTIGIGEGAALRAPMAIAVIGGLFTSTLLTLVVIPCAYRIITRKAPL